AAKAPGYQARNPKFTGRPGLDHKFYLYDSAENIYAPIYLWQDHEASQKFLLDPLFAEVIGTLGREDATVIERYRREDYALIARPLHEQWLTAVAQMLAVVGAARAT
ncbi:MAG: DUF4865 family protein, partial [Rhizobiales bacterium]|nr:DUF4865 family protein [Hyphomicrobiales bacterium]